MDEDELLHSLCGFIEESGQHATCPNYSSTMRITPKVESEILKLPGQGFGNELLMVKSSGQGFGKELLTVKSSLVERSRLKSLHCTKQFVESNTTNIPWKMDRSSHYGWRTKFHQARVCLTI
ncbi:unnamed protein product [Sphenostylis stenocarpa]|uniref:Uncharacterized protein n=1 Tax=Sphenostylis stenocarpa TaxID=92480 RepID=A0AA86VU51_9FABA|nr:unnamed protein product [Sphenostylis stenocarpa]